MARQTFENLTYILLFNSFRISSALREVKPLTTEQWNQVTTQLKDGPTEKSVKTVNEAVEFAKKIKID